MRASIHPFQSKPGRHGTLYRFRFRYTDRSDDGMGPMDWHTWAYDYDHAEERFYADGDDGWSILAVDKVRDTSRLKERPRGGNPQSKERTS